MVPNDRRPSFSKMVGYFLLGAVALVGLATTPSLCEVVGAGEYVIKQSVLDGSLTVWKEPGPKWQGFGKVVHYPRSKQFWFSSKNDQGDTIDQSIKTRFNDGGHGDISGSVRYQYPSSDADLLEIHKQFGSAEAVDQHLIRTTIENAVYVSGPLVSSTQSYAEKRAEFMSWIEDQASRGKYKSSSHCEKQTDPITKTDRTVCNTVIERDKDGNVSRLEESPVMKYHISFTNWSFNDTKYDKDIESQIRAQQAAVGAVQTAAAQARQAEQRAITTEQEGKATAAKAKWDQETVAAKAVTEAQQKKDVARLEKEAAEYTKQRLILEGEGESAKRRAIMSADGALAQKLEAVKEINRVWADAYTHQRPTPDVVFGGGSSDSGMSSTQDLVRLMVLNSAKQVGLSLASSSTPPKTK